MSFNVTSTDIYLEDGHILVAYLQREDGTYSREPSKIDLNGYIGNSDDT